MNKMYLLGSFLFAASLCSAQQNVPNSTQSTSILEVNRGSVKTTPTVAKGDDTEIFWSEDFSDGLTDWTVDGEQGSLWFITYPMGATDGYDPATAYDGGAHPLYGDSIPNFWGTGTTIASATADNGFVMLDADRYNSSAIEGDETGVDFTHSGAIEANLESPSFSLAGISNAQLAFTQDMRFCCSDYGFNVEFSVDNGDTWIPYDLFAIYNGAGNVAIDGLAGIDISDVLQGAATDLTECKIRFVYDPALVGGPSTYYVMLDDISIQSLPVNDLIIGSTWFNNHFESPAEEPDFDFVHSFEYYNQPNTFTREFNFAAEVTNNGVDVQTNVYLEVTFTPPGDGATPQVFQTPVIAALESGVTDTLRLYDVIPDSWVTPIDGTYLMDYEVFQDQEDETPDDNIGTSRGTRISSIGSASGAIMQNDGNAFTNFYPTLGENLIWGNRMTFTDADEAYAITHVEFVLSGSTQAPSLEGEPCHVNVATGSVFTEISDDNELVRAFDDEEVEYVVDLDDVTNGGTPNWISVELPTPVLIEAGKIYTAELQIPASGTNGVILAFSNQQESSAGVLYDFADPSEGVNGWYTLGDLASLIRFKTDMASSVNSITYEAGIKLVQNYPNPVVDNTRIQFQLDETSATKLEVMDMNGKLVYSQDLGVIPSSTAYTVEFNRGNLAAGVYTYSIVTATERVTRKMTLSK